MSILKRITLPALIAIATALVATGCGDSRTPDSAAVESVAPHIFPDYTGIVIPPNIAPLNFEVREKGDEYHVVISCEGDDETINIRSSNAKIRIPEKQWKQLLQNNTNKDIAIGVYVRRNDGWHQYRAVSNHIADETIDQYLYYRDIAPTNGLWNRMAMHQRNLENFSEEKLFDNYRIEHDCMNCHTFNHNNPDEFLFHVRGGNGGTVFYKDGEMKKIVFPSSDIIAAGAYCNWHPDGRLVAFAVNKIKQNYYLSGYGDKMKEVFDLESDIVLYDTEANCVFTYPQIASEMRENLPAWSADGRRMFFVTAAPYVANMPNEENVYSLMQVSFDPATNSFGEPELLVAGETLNGSISFPVASPDGRFLLFIFADFGYFPVNNKSADIYLMDLENKTCCKPDINSDESESYISWSSNGRWFVFSSRRLDGMTSRPFICHIDTDGNMSKPFIIPQKDPGYYAIDHRNFSRPELIRDRVKPRFRDFEKVIFRQPTEATLK